MTRYEFNKVLIAERKANHMGSFFKMWLGWNDNYRVFRLLQLLRKVEYYSSHRNGLGKFFYLWHLLQFRRMRVKSDIMLFPNTIGPGLKLVHPGFRRIGQFVKIGANCTILPMVLFGRKRPTDTDSQIIVGDNCYISTGVTILGPVTIGDNVTIGAGAVVTKDIPDNTVVGGVPAKILKYKG